VDRLNREHVVALAGERAGPCVSIYQPADPPGREALEGPIRFKNLLDAAEDRLVAGGLRQPDARELLREAWALHGDAGFHRAPGLALALFAAPGFFEYYRVPLEVEERVVVGDRFHITPLFPLLTGDGRFFVLALSQNQVRLLEGDRHGVREVALDPKVAQSLGEWKQYDEDVESLQFHTRTDNPISAGERGGIFYGSGSGADKDVKDDILQWFKQLEDAVEAKIRGERAPLLLAGVEYLLPLYRQASGYPRILDEAITGNQDNTPAAELHKRAWELVEPHFADDERAAREAYAIQAGRGTGLSRLGEVLRAAHDGRIDTLFVKRGAQRWGAYDNVKRKAVDRAPAPGEEPQNGDRDLLDLAATQTLLMGGTVFVVEDVPGGGELAAAVRY
jgi:hypothetical protein